LDAVQAVVGDPGQPIPQADVHCPCPHCNPKEST
jgi:hypothetical protein